MAAIRPRAYSAADAERDPKIKEDGYITKVVKYIPAEIVGAHVAAMGLIKAAGKDELTIAWVVFGVLLVMTPIWILVMAAEDGKPRPVFQAVAGAVAFVAWVFAIGEPGQIDPLIGSLMLIFVTLMLPLAEKIFINKVE